VILLDADLRNPALHTFFKIPNHAGLSTLLLTDDPSPAPLLRDTAFDHVRILPSGPSPSNPAELLSSPKMAAILTRLQSQADVVILDSGPVLAVADTAPLAGYVDALVLVVDPKRTQLGELAQAAGIARRANVPIWGVVLSKVKANDHAERERYIDAVLPEQADGEAERWAGMTESRGAS
jgi:non-specific protein-tyrosine kinase